MSAVKANRSLGKASGSPTFHIEGSVACLSVSGDQAVVGIDVDPELSNFPTRGVLMEVEDNGAPGADPADVFLTGPVDDPSSCVARIPSPPPDFVEGDVTVTDAPPRPTTKIQCRDDGYERFAFKNQGECIAFVQRGSK